MEPLHPAKNPLARRDGIRDRPGGVHGPHVPAGHGGDPLRRADVDIGGDDLQHFGVGGANTEEWGGRRAARDGEV